MSDLIFISRTGRALERVRHVAAVEPVTWPGWIRITFTEDDLGPSKEQFRRMPAETVQFQLEGQ